MGLKEKIKEFVFDFADILATPFMWGIEWGVEKVLDLVGKAFAPKLRDLLGMARATGELPPETDAILKEMESPTGEIAAMLGYSAGGAAAGGIISSTIGPYLLPVQYWGNRTVRPARLEPMAAVAAMLRLPDLSGMIKEHLADQGWGEGPIAWLKELGKVYLDIDTLRQLYLRGELTEARAKEELNKQGWEDTKISAAMKLWQVIPPLSDITTMAMRLAFSPESREYWPWAFAAPADFVAAAAKIGLSKEWCEYYWFIHWVQPSPGQLFEMLHRGEATEADIRRALWALGYSDFWIDKFIAVSYRPFTRVDVRRMHALGVLGRDEVKRAYLDIGYDDAKAEAMTNFTIRYNATEDRELTKTDVLTLYRKGVLTEDDTRESLMDIGYSAEDADYLISRENVQGDEAVRELSLTQVKKLALQGIIDKTEATERLAERGYDVADIEKLYDLWGFEAEPQDRLPSRTDLERFFKAGIIDIDTWIDGMYSLRYPQEVIAWFYQLMTSSE